MDAHTNYKERYARRLFDLAVLLEHLRSFDGKTFATVCALLQITPSDAQELIGMRRARALPRSRSGSVVPGSFQLWTNHYTLRTFLRSQEATGDGELCLLAARTVDLARVVAATPGELCEAGRASGKFPGMSAADWQLLLKQGVTSLRPDWRQLYGETLARYV